MNTRKTITFIWLSFLIGLFASAAFAWGGSHGGSHGSSSYRGNGGSYHGSYINHGYGGFHGYHGWGYAPGYFPYGYSVVYVDGNEYYYSNGCYYSSCPAGYVEVPEPVVAQVQQVPVVQTQPTPVITAQTQSYSDDSVTINIPNVNGGFTAVLLIKCKDGYKGPQGEFYPKNPTVAQLRLLYGK